MRIEALLTLPDGKHICEKLGNPRFPDNIGRVRCLGGRQDEDETPHATIIRELREEYGIAIDMTHFGTEIVLPGRAGVRRFPVAAEFEWLGRDNLEKDGTQLVLTAQAPVAWSYEDTKHWGAPTVPTLRYNDPLHARPLDFSQRRTYRAQD